MSALKEFVKSRLLALDVNPFEAARSAGLKREFINDILIDRKMSVRGDNLDKLASALKTSTEELLAVQRNQKIIESFDPDKPAAECDPDEPASKQSFPRDAMIELASKAGLGDGQIAETVYRRNGDEIVQTDPIKDDYWRFPTSFTRHILSTNPDRMVVIECQGDSMEPTLKSGERVWVDTAHIRPTPDGLYAIRDQLGGIVVKRLELDPNKPRLRIISDNPLHSPSEVGFNEITIIGKVKCSLRMF